MITRQKVHGYLPEESYRWIYLEEKFAKFPYVMKKFAPHVRKTELFVRGVGQETDIGKGDVYFEHRNKESFSLKPEVRRR